MKRVSIWSRCSSMNRIFAEIASTCGAGRKTCNPSAIAQKATTEMRTQPNDLIGAPFLIVLNGPLPLAAESMLLKMGGVFELLAKDSSSKARRGRLTTAHGVIETPAFMPVGTQGSVKAVSPRELHEMNAQVVLGNTYHLFVRPGLEVIAKFGGLHRFMKWEGPILTDSGGYQIFSLAKLRKITEEGAHFQNHLDGTPTFISPEIAMEIQAALGSDVAMVLDECPPWPCEHDYAARSLEMTVRWARRCKQAAEKRPVERDVEAERSPTNKQLVFGIVQGGTFEDLRIASAQATVEIGFDGYAIG